MATSDVDEFEGLDRVPRAHSLKMYICNILVAICCVLPSSCTKLLNLSYSYLSTIILAFEFFQKKNYGVF